MKKKFFVSHASMDTGVALEFVRLLQSGMGVSESEIFCTSSPGQGVSPGLDFVESIKKTLEKSEVSIVLITPNFFSSNFCMCELGAIWGASRRFYPVLVPPMDFEDLDGVLANTQAIRADSKSDLDVFYDSVVTEVLKSKASSTATWNRSATEFINNLSIHYRKLTDEKIEGINFLNKYVLDIATALNHRTATKSSSRTKRECFFVVFDIDKMSAINKKFGSHNGDRLLRYLADYLESNYDHRYIVGGRCGDDTFYTLFWGTQKQAISLCKNFLEVAREVPGRLGMTMFVTASGAVSRFTGAETIADVITSANNALIDARDKNGDCCVVGEDPDPSIDHNHWS